MAINFRLYTWLLLAAIVSICLSICEYSNVVVTLPLLIVIGLIILNKLYQLIVGYAYSEDLEI